MKEIIEKFLLKFAEENEWDKYNPDKLQDCLSFIRACAKKKSQNGVAMIEDREVFGWAVHFFDEDGNVEMQELNEKKEQITAPTVKPDVVKVAKAKKPVKKVENKNYDQIGFDLGL